MLHEGASSNACREPTALNRDGLLERIFLIQEKGSNSKDPPGRYGDCRQRIIALYHVVYGIRVPHYCAPLGDSRSLPDVAVERSHGNFKWAGLSFKGASPDVSFNLIYLRLWATVQQSESIFESLHNVGICIDMLAGLGRRQLLQPRTMLSPIF
jgi:hypothetical protein